MPNDFRNRDALLERARRLLPAANVLAASSLKTMMNKLPGGFAADDWDFFVTVAGTHTGLQALYEMVGPGALFDGLDATVREAAQAWTGDAIAALDDCQNFVEHNVNELRAEGFDPDDLFGDAIGMWVLINVLQRQPQDTEIHAARPIGIVLVRSFSSWWDPATA